MSIHYPLPIADKEFVDQLIAIYQDNYGVDIPCAEAKEFLEQLMHFVYLTQIDPIVFELVGHYNDPLMAQEVMKELRRRGEWGQQKTDEENTTPGRLPD